MKPEVNKIKQKAGLLYGLAAGLAFAIFAWGIDGLLLAIAHGNFPWVKFLPGLLICLLSGALVGWLTIWLANTFLGILLWFAQALLYAELVPVLPLRISPAIIKFLNPALTNYLNYPYYPEFIQSFWLSILVIAVVSIICALLENILIDQALFSSGEFTIIVPLVVVFLAFGLAGRSTDTLLNEPLREPVIIVDRLINFFIANKDKEVPSAIARSMHLAALASVKTQVTQERRLILGTFDQDLGAIDVLVDFKGQWIKCTTIYNQVSVCKQLFEQSTTGFSTNRKMDWNPHPVAFTD